MDRWGKKYVNWKIRILNVISEYNVSLFSIDSSVSLTSNSLLIHSDMGQAPPPEPTPAPVPIAATNQSTTKTANYTHTRIQIRNQDGSTLTETFEVKESLAAIRLFIQLKQGAAIPFNLMTTFPRRVFTEEDYDKPLYLLGLVPSAVLIVTKA